MTGFAMFNRYGSLEEVWIAAGCVQEISAGDGGTKIYYCGGGHCWVTEPPATVIARLLNIQILERDSR